MSMWRDGRARKMRTRQLRENTQIDVSSYDDPQLDQRRRQVDELGIRENRTIGSAIPVYTPKALQQQNLDPASPLPAIYNLLEQLQVAQPFQLEDLGQLWLSEGAQRPRHEAAVEEDALSLEVVVGVVVERSGEFEDADEKFGGELVEHGGGGEWEGRVWRESVRAERERREREAGEGGRGPCGKGGVLGCLKAGQRAQTR